MQFPGGRAATTLLLLSCTAIAAAPTGCRRGNSHAATATIAQAAPRPAPLSPETVARVAQQPVTTSGSPPPFVNAHAQFEPVVLGHDAIEVRKLVPAGATIFRITNRDTVPRGLTIDGATTHAAVGRQLAPGETVMLQMILKERRYVLADPDVPSRGRVVVKTYVPH